MMLRRRCPSAAGPMHANPSSSGPRCRNDATIPGRARCSVVSSATVPAIPHMEARARREGGGVVREALLPVPVAGPPQAFQERVLRRVAELLRGPDDVERAVLAIPVDAAGKDRRRDPERPAD